MRRSRKDIQLGRRLTIGQTWRRRNDGSMWRIHQVHRGDCHVELTRPRGHRIIVPFDALREDWDQIVPADQAVVA